MNLKFNIEQKILDVSKIRYYDVMNPWNFISDTQKRNPYIFFGKNVECIVSPYRIICIDIYVPILVFKVLYKISL